jgi:DNA-binding NarL/FixJ family response regulator
VSMAFDGEEGFQAILSKRPDIALVDITMPVLSGFDLLQRLVSIAPRFDSMPFLYLTALSDRANELKGRQLGADDYITKPIDFDILTTIITARLTRVARTAVWPRIVELTDREVETLTWAARGKTSSEIATILGLTKRTVDFHIDNARLKLNATSRMHAAVKAAAGQLIEP